MRWTSILPNASERHTISFRDREEVARRFKAAGDLLSISRYFANALDCAASSGVLARVVVWGRQSQAATSATATHGTPITTKLSGTPPALATALTDRLPIGVLPMKIIE